MNEILTPCVLQNIIICSTIIILSVVAVSAFKIHKVENRKRELKLENTENGSCLGSYIFLSSIVVLIAVVIFSYAFFSDKKVLDFMSLASALVSIILAVITIIYSFVINSQTSGQVDKLTTASTSLQEATGKSIESIQEMKMAAQQVIKASKTYDSSAQMLDNNIKEILRCIKGISHKVGADTDYETVGELRDSDELDEFKDVVLSQFNDENSNAGAILIYLCSKVKETEKTCDLRDFFGEDTFMYYFGYIVALNAIGFTAIDIDFTSKTIKAADVVETLIKGAKQRLESESDNKFIKENRQKIDDYFSVKDDVEEIDIEKTE